MSNTDKPENDWQPIDTAPSGVWLDTKIDDEYGVRNEQSMKRDSFSGLWFVTHDMYVYYTPTHWRHRRDR